MIREDLERIVLTEIAAGFGKNYIDPEEDLLEQGIIDSLGLIKLITFMENSFGIRIADEEIIPENFQSLNTMARLVEQQQNNLAQ